MKKVSRLLSLLLSTVLCLTAFGTKAESTPQKYSYSFFNTFDTIVTLIGYNKDKADFDKLAAEVEERFIRYHQCFDQYHAYEGINNLYTLNHEASKAPVKVPTELYQIIRYCKDVQPFLHNTTNIAMGSVLSLWHDAREISENDPAKAHIPAEDELKAASLHTDMKQVILNDQEQTVFYADPALQLDLGAIAKGYAVELAAQYMLTTDMPSFIINAGGNVRTGHPPMDGRKGWGVAVQDPEGVLKGDQNKIIESLYLSDLSVVTSGDYQRYYTVDGVHYHHIISPQTLMPASFMRSVTIVTQDSGLADLLSTTLYLMTYEQGLELISRMDGVDALWVLNDMTVKMTDGLVPNAASQGAKPE